MSALDATLDRITRRHAELRDLLATGGGGEFARLSKEYSELSPVVEAVEVLRKAQADMAEA